MPDLVKNMPDLVKNMPDIAEFESLMCVPLEADPLNGVPWLQAIRSESMAGRSTIEMIFALGIDPRTGA